MSNDEFNQLTPESQRLLESIQGNIFSFEEVNQGFRNTESPLDNLRTSQSFDDISAEVWGNSPFKALTPEQIAKEYYNNEYSYKNNGITVYTDKGVPIDKSKEAEPQDPIELADVIAHPNEHVFTGVTEKEDANFGRRFFYSPDVEFTFTVFMSSDGAWLLEQWKKCNINSSGNQIAVFLETNVGSNIAGSVIRIKTSKDVEKYNIPIVTLLSKYNSIDGVKVKTKVVKELLEDGLYKTKKGFFSWLFGTAISTYQDIKDFFNDEVIKRLGQTFNYIGQQITKEGAIAENRWNPNVEQGEYNPLFSGFEIQKIEKTFNSNLPNTRKKLIKRVVNTQFRQIDALFDKFEKQASNVKSLLPNRVYKKLKKALNRVKSELEKLRKELTGTKSDLFKKIEEFFATVEQGNLSKTAANTTIEFFNALFCGLWNSLVGIISGIFSLIGILFLVIAFDNDRKEKLYYKQLLLEYLENFLDALASKELLDNLIDLFFFPITTSIKLARFLLTARNITAAQIGYFAGALVGFVVEIGIDILFSRGTLTVKGIGEALQKSLEYLQSSLKKIVKGKNTPIEKLFAIIRVLNRKLKKGELGDELNKMLDDLLGLSKKYSDDAIKGKGLYGGKILTKAELEDWAKLLKRKYGTKLKKVDGFDKPNIQAQFDPNTNTIKYKDDVTEYFMAHESYHAEHMDKIGFKEYTKNAHVEGTPWTIENRIVEYKHEKYVYERLLENKELHKLNLDEIGRLEPPYSHAFEYFDTIKAKLEILLRKNNIPFPD